VEHRALPEAIKGGRKIGFVIPAEDGDAAAMRELRRQASSSTPLDPGEAKRLLEHSARGDRASEDRLVAANLSMIIRLADVRGERGLSTSDLVQEGSIGLVQAMRTFAGSGQDDFTAFAEQKVGEQMDAAIEAEAAAVRDGELLVAAAGDYERTELLLGRTLRRLPTAAEIAEKLEWTVERTTYVGEVVAEARRRHDEEVLALVDPEAIELDVDDDDDGEL